MPDLPVMWIEGDKIYLAKLPVNIFDLVTGRLVAIDLRAINDPAFPDQMMDSG